MKKLNIKALMIDHAEKFVFGMFGLIVLLILWQTNWERYKQTPDALKQKVKEVRDKISSESNVWPVAEQQAHKIVDFSDKARQMFAPMAPIALARYSFTPPLFHPLYRKDEPRREPTFEPVQYLITKAGFAPLSMSIQDATSSAEEPAKVAMEESKQPADDGGEFAARNPAVGATGGPPGMVPPTGMGAPPGMVPPTGMGAPPNSRGSDGNRPPNFANGPPTNRPPGNPAKGHAAPSGVRPFGSMPGGNAAAEEHAPPTVKARGVRFVAVRGVFPLAKQIDNYKNALKMSQSEAQTKLEIADFVLQRQTAVAGPDPWDEKLTQWETVHLDSAIEILSECSDLDTNDPVPAALRDAVITMNLPLRLIGYWREYATHPKIKDLELKGDAIEQQNKMLESLDATLSETQTPEAKKPSRRGLATVQRDVKSMVSAVKSSASNMDAYKSQMQQQMAMMAAMQANSAQGRPPMNNPGVFAQGGMRGPQDLDRLVAISKYVLFRFFDFDVESGMAYRYRVKLKLRNPNFELSPDELAGADPEITNGEERETPWSNISNPAVVDNTFNYYLKDIEREPYNEEKVRPVEGKPVAQMDVFDWDTSFGTVVKDVLNLPAIGAFIGGIGGGLKRETTVLDLVDGSIVKKKDRKFTSLDVLVDVESEADIPIEQHPDLKLAANSDRRGQARLNLSEEALIATHTGDLRILNPIEDKAGEDKWNARLNAERADFKEGSPTKKPSRLDALTGAAQDDDKPKKKRRKGKSALIKSASSQLNAPTQPGR